jgi:hypothetical protein
MIFMVGLQLIEIIVVMNLFWLALSIPTMQNCLSVQKNPSCVH